MSPPPDTLAWKLSVLSASPYFRNVPSGSLTTLADAMHVVFWPREHIFADRAMPWPISLIDPFDTPPLSVIASGKVAIVQRFTTESSRRLIGPGEMFGLESVQSWLYPTITPTSQIIATTIDESYCLELYPGDFEAVLGTDPNVEPLRSILQAWALMLAYPTAASALASTQELSCMRQDQLQALLTGASVINLGPGEPLPGISMGQTPNAVYVLLDGQVDRVSVPIVPGSPPLASACVGRLDPGQVIGLNELFDQQAMGYSVVSRDARLLCMTKQLFLDAPSQIPGFLRAVVQGVGPTQLYTPLLATAYGRLLSATTVAMVPASAEAGAKTTPLVDHLADYIAEKFREDVLVVRVHPTLPPSPPMPFETWENLEYMPKGNILVIDVELGSFTAPWLAGWVNSCWDVILIEPIGFDPVYTPGNPFVMALVGLGIPVTTSTLLDSPGVWDEISSWMPQVLLRWALPTALLCNNDGMGLPASWAPPPGGGVLAQLAAKALAIADGAVTAVRHEFEEQAALLGPDRSCDGVTWPTWPVGTARLLFTQAALSTLSGAPLDAAGQEAIARWARAITRRRVGVAIGGAGAISFVGSGMLEGLAKRGVPVDMVSGTSFGAVVGAFYASGGQKGLDRLTRFYAYIPLYGALSYSMISTLPLAVWADVELGFADLNDLPVALFPVATLASNEHEWPIRSGTVGNALRAAGSLPPFAPTVHGTLRLIDGGYSADVPCQVLSDEGADLIIAVNPYSFPAVMPRSRLWIPFVSAFISEQNPLLRTLDWTRGYQMLWRFAAKSQLAYADVVYNNDNPHTAPVSFFAGRRIARSALRSDAMKAALHQASQAWGALLGDPDAFLITTGTPTHVEINIPVKFTRTFGFAGLTPKVEQVLMKESVDLVSRAGRTILAKAPITGTITITIMASGEGSLSKDIALAAVRGERVKQLLVYAGLPAAQINVNPLQGSTDMVTITLDQP